MVRIFWVHGVPGGGGDYKWGLGASDFGRLVRLVHLFLSAGRKIKIKL